MVTEAKIRKEKQEQLKKKIRNEVRAKLNKQNNTQRLRKSRLIQKRLFHLAEFKRAKYVMFYIAIHKEVETLLMIRAAQRIGKRIAVPVISQTGQKMVREARQFSPSNRLSTKGKQGRICSRHPAGRSPRMIASLVGDLTKELTLGPYEILQPKTRYIREIPVKKIDLVVVPGLAFDRQGRRLGRGGGYYDAFLAKVPARTPRIGLAFDFQVLKALPVLSHDISVTRIISA